MPLGGTDRALEAGVPSLRKHAEERSQLNKADQEVGAPIGFCTQRRSACEMAGRIDSNGYSDQVIFRSESHKIEG